MDEKREDHPLWNEFVKWMGVRHGKALPHSQDDWDCFIAGAEACKDANLSSPCCQAIDRLDDLANRVPTVSVAVADRLANAVERLEELGKRQGEFGDRQGQVTHELNEHTNSLYNLLRRQEQAMKRTEAIAEGLQGMNLMVIESKIIHPPDSK